MNYSCSLLVQERWSHFKDHPSTCGHLTCLRNKPQQKQSGQLSVPIRTYLSELLVNVYSYCLMVKSVTNCCVCGSQLQSHTVCMFVLCMCSMYIDVTSEVLVVSMLMSNLVAVNLLKLNS